MSEAPQQATTPIFAVAGAELVDWRSAVPSAHTSDETLDAFSQLLVTFAQDLATSVTKEPGRAQDAAYWEFVYGLMYITIQQLGHDVTRQRLMPRNELDELIVIVHRKLLADSLRARLRDDVSHEAFRDMFNAHSEAVGLRADYYMPMRTFPAEGKGTAGSLTWEIPKQAVRSAYGGVDEHFVELMATTMLFPALLLDLHVPQFMQHLAEEYREEKHRR